MTAPAEDVKDILVTAGVGKFTGYTASDWRIFVGEEQPTPDKSITLYDSGGVDPDPKYRLDYPAVQARVRSAVGDYQGAHTKAVAVQDALLGLTPQTINSKPYYGILMRGGINFIGRDDMDRPIFTLNFSILLQPASGTYRLAI